MIAKRLPLPVPPPCLRPPLPTADDEGIFEHFINIESQRGSPEQDRLVREIITTASEVAHEMEGFSGARIGGSQEKHTLL
jgi:hypothetical protein